MADFREPDFDNRPSSVRTGVWTARPPATQPPTTTAHSPQVRANEPAAGASGALQTRIEVPWRKALRGVLLAFGAMFAVLFALIFAYRWINPPTTALIAAQQFTGMPIDRSWRTLDQISPHLARAVIMSEDAGFCGHFGVDFGELERVYERGIEGNMRGGSTIAMQVIKNLYLWPSRSYVRKALEIPLTLVADRWWGKRRMLEFYLNIVEWGPGIFGAEAAANRYFNKPASRLTEHEAALLAVALPNPLSRNSAAPSDLQRRLASVVEHRMRVGTNNVRCLKSAAP